MNNDGSTTIPQDETPAKRSTSIMPSVSSSATLNHCEPIIFTQAEGDNLLLNDSLFMPPPTKSASALAVESSIPSSSLSANGSSTEKGTSKSGLSSKLIDAPRPMDVLLGRGGKYRFHPGNTRLAILVSINQKRYDASNSRLEKTSITQDMVNQIKNCGTERGRFLKPDYLARGWREVSDEMARQKCSNSLRYARTVKDVDMKSQVDIRAFPKRSLSTTAVPEPLLTPSMTNVSVNSSKRRRTSEHLVSNEEILSAIGYGDFSSLL